MRRRRCLEDEDGSDGAEASATPTHSVDGSPGCLDGGGRIQPSASRIIVVLGVCRA